MAKTKFLARDLTIEVEDPDLSGETFIPIGGLNSLTHSPSTTRADTTDFDSNGHEEHLVAQRGESWTLAGYYIEDVVTGEKDAGQARCEALGLVGSLASMGRFRVTSPGGNTITFDGSCEVTLHGGGTNDAAAWQCVVTVSGASEYASAGSSS